MTQLEQIGQKIGEVSKTIYDNPKSFFKFFNLDGNAINYVSVSENIIVVSWRHKVTQTVHSFWVPFDWYYKFIESL